MNFRSVYRNICDILRVLLCVGFVIGVIYGLFWADYKIWRTAHPNAPTWVYFVKGKH